MRAIYTDHLILHDLMTIIIFGEEWKLRRFSLCLNILQGPTNEYLYEIFIDFVSCQAHVFSFIYRLIYFDTSLFSRLWENFYVYYLQSPVTNSQVNDVAIESQSIR
jgi:hypothetical protein